MLVVCFIFPGRMCGNIMPVPRLSLVGAYLDGQRSSTWPTG